MCKYLFNDLRISYPKIQIVVVALITDLLAWVLNYKLHWLNTQSKSLFNLSSWLVHRWHTQENPSSPPKLEQGFKEFLYRLNTVIYKPWNTDESFTVSNLVYSSQFYWAVCVACVSFYPFILSSIMTHEGLHCTLRTGHMRRFRKN